MLSKFRQLALVVVPLSFLLILLALGLLYKNLHAPLQVPVSSAATDQVFSFVIPPGFSLSQVTQKLEDEGVMQNAEYLVLYARMTGKASQIKAGEYELESSLTALELLNKMVAGNVLTHQLVLLEGWTIAQTLQSIQSNQNIVSTIVVNPEMNLSEQNVLEEIFDFSVYPEGRFFPDTYQFTSGTTDQQILQRAKQLMEQVLAEEWERRAVDLPYETPLEALIMASIVEKETAVPEEREIIAGVFVRRLQQGMRLQTDPTVIYGLGENFDGNLTRVHLRTRTPYNTYTNSGLPPTPIASVGREALSASLHPDQSDSLYFVAKGDGSHYFSSTLAEHNEAVQRFQIDERNEDYRSQPVQ